MEGRTIVRFAFLAAFRNTKIPLPQILITHHISLTLSGAEYLVQMNNGRIALKGPVSELDKADITSELVEKAEEEDIDAVIEDEEGAAADAAAEPSTEEVAKPTASGKLVDEEVRETGRVKGKVYSTYLTASGWWTWGAIMFVLLFGRTFRESSSPSLGSSNAVLWYFFADTWWGRCRRSHLVQGLGRKREFPSRFLGRRGADFFSFSGAVRRVVQHHLARLLLPGGLDHRRRYWPVHRKRVLGHLGRPRVVLAPPAPSFGSGRRLLLPLGILRDL